MGNYTLIDLDESESSRVRHMLHQWNKADEEAIRPLVLATLQKHGISNLQVTEPRWETNVYPLYYWALQKVDKNTKRVYSHVLEVLPKLFSMSNVSLLEEELRLQLRHTVNSEIDILVEDSDYFLFIETKNSKVGQQSKFHRQLVRQYVQGRILEKLIDKRFLLAAIGANNAELIEFPLTTTELALLRLVNEERQSLEIPDLSWPPLTAAG